MTESTDKQLLDQAAADEQQLDEYLKGDSSVSRQYRELPGAEVPAELDRIVLRQAADAVQTRSTGRPAWMRWTAPLAVAASAVLVLSIVIETGPKDETAQVMSDLSVAVSARKAEQALESDRIGGATEETAGGEAIVSGQAAPVQAPAMAPAPRLEAQASVPAQAPPLVVQAERQARAVASRAEPKVERPQAMQSAPTARPASAPPAASSPITAGESVARSADVAAAVLKAAAAEQAARQSSAKVANDGDLEEEYATAVVSGFSPHNVTSTMPATAPPYSDPEQWLEDIRQLRKDDKQQEADREWRRFRAAFPDYAVAPDDPAREAKP